MTTYMRWSKMHPRVRYELTDSGVPGVERHEWDMQGAAVHLINKSPYGDPRLIEAIARRYRVSEAGVVPVPGASSGIFIALAMAASPGAKVLIEKPVYEPVRLVAEFLQLNISWLHRSPQRAFEVRLEDVEMGLDAGASVVVLCNLHNPSGRVMAPDRMQGVVERCARAGATLVVDEAYLDAWSLNGEHTCWTAASLGENVLAINSLTKIYGLSGLRLGWIATSPRLAERARGMMDLLSVNNAAPSMSLGLAALYNLHRLEERFRGYYAAGQPVFRAWLAKEPRVRGYSNDGAIFECIQLPAGITGRSLNERLSSDFDTQVTPGEFFGLDDHVRLSVALRERTWPRPWRISGALDQMMA